MAHDPVTSYSCPYCRSLSSGAETTCPNCGAPVDVARRTTSGWVEQPPIPDMTRIQMGGSTMQILGRLAPAADVRLAAGEGVFFPQHSLLWQDPAVRVDAMSLNGSWNRMRSGLAVVMLQATGPGTISFSATPAPGASSAGRACSRWGMHVEFPHAGTRFWRSWGNRYLWLRLWGPGRVALQSSYDRLEDPGSDFQDSCQFTQQVW